MSSLRQIQNKWNPASPVQETMVVAPNPGVLQAGPAASPAYGAAPIFRSAPVSVPFSAAAVPQSVPSSGPVAVRLLDFKDAKLATIKEARALTSLGLKESKDLVEQAPVILKRGLTLEAAQSAVSSLTKAGAVADIVPDA